MILAGDIGGTHTRIALFEGKEKIKEVKYKSKNYQNLIQIVLEFLQKEKKVDIAVFGIAGPIRNGKCKTTNLPWIVDAKEIQDRAKITQVHLINDLMANAYGIRAIKDEEFYVLNKGNSQNKGNAALISAGTGLGEAGIYWDGKEFHPFACEGGHADFAPKNELEWQLFKYLQVIFGHVSYERVLSGPGIENIYRFFVETQKENPIQGDFPDLSRVISQKAIEKSSEVAQKTLKLFLSIYAAEAGNVALKFLALSGVYIGGGIAPTLLPLLKAEEFMKSFADKGRFQELLLSISVKVILNEDTALLGSHEFALDKIKFGSI